MREELRSAIAWATMFLSLELPAHYHLDRWIAAPIALLGVVIVIALQPLFTLSSTVWDAEKWWHPLVTAVVIFAFVLVVHLVRHISASYLILVAAAIAIATIIHAFLPFSIFK